MTIEMTRAKSTHTFRINPYAPTEIDYKENKHRSRWLFHSRHATPEEATAKLLELERNESKDEA